MMSNQRGTVDLRDFIVDGLFAGVQLGQTPEQVLGRLPAPDRADTEADGLGKGCEIWNYGHLELHFLDGALFAISCDNFKSWDEAEGRSTDTWDAGPSINLEPWVFARPHSLTLDDMLGVLNGNAISFTLLHNPRHGNILIRILKSHVELVFESDIDADTTWAENPDSFRLTAFSLSTASAPHGPG